MSFFCKDKEDDISIGVKSTALLFKDKSVPWLGLFSSVMVANLITAGYMADQTWPYFAAVSGVSAQLAWQVQPLQAFSIKHFEILANFFANDIRSFCKFIRKCIILSSGRIS